MIFYPGFQGNVVHGGIENLTRFSTQCHTSHLVGFSVNLGENRGTGIFTFELTPLPLTGQEPSGISDLSAQTPFKIFRTNPGLKTVAELVSIRKGRKGIARSYLK